jgi:hypothetical protein
LSILALNNFWVGNWPVISKRLTETVMKGWTIKTSKTAQWLWKQSVIGAGRSHNLTWSLAGKVWRREKVRPNGTCHLWSAFWEIHIFNKRLTVENWKHRNPLKIGKKYQFWTIFY